MDKNDVLGSGLSNRDIGLMSAPANIIWQPVKQLRLGWEVMAGERKGTDFARASGTRTNDAMRGQFGAWFYF